jgi:hypothetical protein
MNTHSTVLNHASAESTTPVQGTREIGVILYAKEASYVPRLKDVTKGSPRG